MRIRYASFKDLPRILEIEKASFPLPWGFLSFAKELENPYSYFFVLEDEENIWGYACYWIIKDEAYLANIALDPEKRGKGWGRYLLYQTLKECAKKGAKDAMLEVRATNFVAINLYLSLGFEKLGVRPRYYEDGEDALIMKAKLEEVLHEGARDYSKAYREKR